MIPEAYYSISGFFQKLIPCTVSLDILLSGVLPAINLDDELAASTFKINDIR